MRNADKAAMPSTVWDFDNNGNKVQTLGGGLTKREEFAKAMAQGLLAGGYCIDDARNRLVDVPNEAISLADALLKALEESS